MLYSDNQQHKQKLEIHCNYLLHLYHNSATELHKSIPNISAEKTSYHHSVYTQIRLNGCIIFFGWNLLWSGRKTEKVHILNTYELICILAPDAFW